VFLRPLSGLALVLASALVSCKSNRPAGTAAVSSDTSAAPADAAPARVTVIATDYALDMPDRIPAGVVTLHLVNRGKELHQAQIVRLEDGKTMADFAQAMKHEGPPPAWVKYVGGPNGIAPGQETESTGSLTAGNYAVLCVIPGPTGTPHIMSGMVHPFEVTAASGGAVAAQLPAAGDTLKLADYTFESSRPLAPGRRTMLVENTGPQPHEMVLLKLEPGKSVEDFAKWAEGGLKGPPPAMPLGGVGALDRGERAVFTVDLTPGDYGFICFVPDSKDGKPHLSRGMMKQIKVG
jgi:uncharacterized cupredoxin-like copper-binding protein